MLLQSTQYIEIHYNGAGGYNAMRVWQTLHYFCNKTHEFRHTLAHDLKQYLGDKIRHK